MAALGTAVPAADGSSTAQEHELRVLYEIIHTVNSTLDLEQVLGAIVRLVNDAIVAHATYIFLSEDRGRRIVLRAASERYAHLSGRVSMAAGEGIAGWVLQNGQPVFIPEKALADPRIKYFPELEEEKYQSLVSVPLIAKGQRVIGVIALHAEAPRVFSPQDAAFLLHVASLVAYAIENARLYERTRRSLRELEQLSQLGAHIARAESVDDLLAVDGRAGARAARRRVAARLPARAERRPAAHARGLARRAGRARHRLAARAERRAAAHAGRRRHAHLGARRHALGRGHHALGARRAARRRRRGDGLPRRAAGRGPARERARARPRQLDRVADRARPQAAAAGRATGRAQPHQGSLRRARRRAQHRCHRRAGTASRHRRGRARSWSPGRCPSAAGRPRPARPSCRRPRPSRRRRCATSRARSSIAPRTSLRLLAPGARRRVGARAHRGHRRGGCPTRSPSGISNVCSGPGACAAGFTEAQQAARALPVLRPGERHLRYDELGVYKYLLRVPPGDPVRDRHADALRVLAEHDRRRNAQLLHTLEEFLRQRGHVGATAQALYVHPNTLRQRLRRIEELTGLDARDADWLAARGGPQAPTARGGLSSRPAHLDD